MSFPSQDQCLSFSLQSEECITISIAPAWPLPGFVSPAGVGASVRPRPQHPRGLGDLMIVANPLQPVLAFNIPVHSFQRQEQD
jgi:hypothetical protein